MGVFHSFWFSFSWVLPVASIWLVVNGALPFDGEGVPAAWALEWACYLAYASLPFANTWLLILWMECRGCDTLRDKKGKIRTEPVGTPIFLHIGAWGLLPLFLGGDPWPFLGLSWLLMALLHNRHPYFNPMFMFFGLNYFYVRAPGGARLLILSKHCPKYPFNAPANNVLMRINDYTFFDVPPNDDDWDHPWPDEDC